MGRVVIKKPLLKRCYSIETIEYEVKGEAPFVSSFKPVSKSLSPLRLNMKGKPKFKAPTKFRKIRKQRIILVSKDRNFVKK